MINLFDLSTGRPGAKPDTGQTHTDGFPVRRIKSELRKATDPDKVHADEKLTDGHKHLSRKSNATSLKMLLAEELSKEVESKRRPPGVVARLMGLEEDLPTEEPVLHHTNIGARKSQLCNHLNVENKVLQPQGKQHYSPSVTQDIRQSCKVVEYNDVYDASEQQARMSNFQDQTLQEVRYSQNQSDRMDIVRENFMDENYFATEERLLHSVLASNKDKDLFLNFFEEPNPIISRQLSELQTTSAPQQRRRITVLKPVRSVDSNGIRQSRPEEAIDQNGLDMRKLNRRHSSEEGIASQPSRIILLRPTPGKPSITKAKLTPRARVTSFRLVDRNDFHGALDDNWAALCSTGEVHDISQQDESLLSSAYSNGYGGDESSFSDSEIDHNEDSETDYIEEEGGSCSDSEGGSPLSKCSWDYIRRYRGSYSGPSFSKISQFPDSSVIKEAKHRLSERWTMVTCDEISQMQFPRRTCTLREMLSLQETKKQDFITGVHSGSSNGSCGTENGPITRETCDTTCRKGDENGERSSRPRSKSVPVVSSRFDYLVANVQASDPEDCMPTDQVFRSKHGKSSFKGRVSDFFFYRSKRPIRQKPTHHPSVSFDEKVEACFADVHSDGNDNIETNGEVPICEDKIKTSAIQKSTSIPEVNASTALPASLVRRSGELDRLRLKEGLNSTRDQPSPTSVLDAPSEESSCNEPESSGSTTWKNAKAVSRSSAIEAVACSLSWDDATSESPSVGIPRSPYLLSDIDDDESEYHVVMQNILSSAGLDGARPTSLFTAWQLPACPLDPVLCNKLLELQARRPYQRLLADCINSVLVEIGEDTLLSILPWSKAQSITWRDTSSPAFGIEVWSILNDWIYGARMFVVSRRDNAGIMVDRVVKQEVEGRGWVKTLRFQLVDITEQIERGLLEELVSETVLDLVT